VAIDGKTSRRSFDGDNRPMHLISTFISELGITLGQLKTADKSNEITAIPELLNLLDLSGAIVTLGSMGCQTKIVERIVEKEADYVIGLKGDQGTLNNDVRLFFENKPKAVTFRLDATVDKGHGRLETRECTVTEDIQWLQYAHPHWKKLNSIIEIRSQRLTCYG
jgi:predicted transposase YbfD/YdcC